MNASDGDETGDDEGEGDSDGEGDDDDEDDDDGATIRGSRGERKTIQFISTDQQQCNDQQRRN